MRTEYHKLVRDRIPEIIRNDGYICETVTMNEAEYQQALREKLVEEALEAAAANEQHLIEELADLYEIIDTIMVKHEIDVETVRTEQQRRHYERGGFEQRIRLIAMSAPDTI